MSIVAECPHCETRFHLQPELVGKAMRCPNSDCREAFVVQPAANPPPPVESNAKRTVFPHVNELPAGSGAVGDFLPFSEAKPADHAAPAPRSVPPAPPVPTPPAPRADAEIVEATLVTSPAVKEVLWTPDADIPPAVPRQEPRRAAADEPEEEPILSRRQKRSNRAPMILIGLVATLVVTGGAAGLFALRYQAQAEARLADQAKQEYEKAEYAQAEKTFDTLIQKYPDGADTAKYRFFHELAALQKTVRSVAVREDPKPAVERLRTFIDTHKDSPFAKPDAYGHDVFAAGQKVVEDVGGSAQDRVKAFQADRAKPDELKQAENLLTLGSSALPLLAAYRTKDDPPLEEMDQKYFAPVRAEIGREQNRLATLAEVGRLLATPTDQAIEDAKKVLAAQLADDAEGAALIRTAEGQFLRRVRFERDPAAPRRTPVPSAASLVFVAPIGPTRPAARGPLDGPPTVFLAIARGLLYALDEDTGGLLWTARVGPDVADPPAVARVDLPEGPAELAVVVSNVAGQSAVSGYVLHTGQPRWYQPLPAPAAGIAAIVGARVFVPVRDALGTVAVFDLASGARLGRLMIGQPVASLAVRPGTEQLYVAAESRRVFVFDVESPDDEGFRPRCVRVIPTGHPTGTLRAAPVFLGPPGDAPAPRWLVLAQADGPTAMKFRAFPLPPTFPANTPPNADAIAPAVELALPGWVSFPPRSDGERLAAITDAGQLRLYGIDQPGNSDPAVFALPSPLLPSPPDGSAVPGLAVPAEEGAFWVLAGGSLQKFRITLKPDSGLTVMPAGAGLPVGVPTQAAQLNARQDTACFVVRSLNSAGCRAVAVRLRDGEPRWQRQLGVIPTRAPLSIEKAELLVDEDGGAVAVSHGVTIPPNATKAPPDWLLPNTPEGASGPTRVAASEDGKTVYLVTPTGTGPTAKWAIRRIVGQAVEHTGRVNAPAPLAGTPAVLGDSLLLPAADGFVYRLVPGDGKLKPDTLAPGPTWWRDRRHPNPVCQLVPVSENSFLTGDGGKGLRRWAWPADASWTDGGAKWDGRERIAGAPLFLPATGGRTPRFLVADVTGGIALYAVDRSEIPVRRWIPGRTVSLPGGAITEGFAMQTDAVGRQLVAYVVDGKQVVCLDVDADEPRWVTPAEDGASGTIIGRPQPLSDGRWLVTDLSGRVSVREAETGRVETTRVVGLPGAVPATAGVSLGDTRLLLPLSDGSAAVLDLLPIAPAPRLKE